MCVYIHPYTYTTAAALAVPLYVYAMRRAIAWPARRSASYVCCTVRRGLRSLRCRHVTRHGQLTASQRREEA